jgi:hypothetical protein
MEEVLFISNQDWRIKTLKLNVFIVHCMAERVLVRWIARFYLFRAVKRRTRKCPAIFIEYLATLTDSRFFHLPSLAHEHLVSELVHSTINVWPSWLVLKFKSRRKIIQMLISHSFSNLTTLSAKNGRNQIHNYNLAKSRLNYERGRSQSCQIQENKLRGCNCFADFIIEFAMMDVTQTWAKVSRDICFKSNSYSNSVR